MNMQRKMILNVPFKEKEQAKALGAYWDPEIKKWFVPVGKDTKPFMKWSPKTDQENTTVNS